MTTMLPRSTCIICGTVFEARHSFGLCHRCYSSDRLRALDKVESAVRQARRNGIAPVTLTTPEWISVLSDHVGLCALCRKSTGSRILRFDRTKGLAYDNVVPWCDLTEVLSSGLNHNLSSGWLAALLHSRQAA